MSQASFKYHKYMIKSAPYGELANVVKNLQSVSEFDTQSSEATQTFRQYNEEHLALVVIDGKVITTLMQDSTYPILKVARDQHGNYIDQLKAKAYQINHRTRQLIAQTGVEVDLPDPVLDLLKILSKKVHNYVDKFYKEPFGSQVFMEVTEEGSLNVHVAFTSKNIQLSNYCTGEWNSVWLINKSKIEGKVSIRSHIFESCNVQMNQDKTISQEFVFSADMEENASKIIKAIETAESQIQKNLGQIYEEMPNGFFKHLRRVVPVTKTTMVWNVHALKMNKNLQQAKK